MQGLIVAAGRGSRLSERAPLKPLAPVQGKPLIAHVIDSAMAAGVTQFVVVTGYQAPQLEEALAALAAQRGAPLTCVRNPDWTARNGVSVAAAAEVLSPQFVLLMADHLFDPAILRDLIASSAPEAVVLAVDRRLDNPLVDLDDVTRVDAAEDGRIRRIGKHIEPYDAFDTGIFLASRALVDAIRADVSAGGGGSISEGMQSLADRGSAATFDIGDRFWLDVDDPPALERAERAAART